VQEAVQYYQKALTYNVQYADAYYNLGVAYGEMSCYDKGMRRARLCEFEDRGVWK
jgi:tetratricopeptide (TPR) repeat protein